MKTLKMSLENIQGKMNRREMKLIMAGSGSGAGACQDTVCTSNADCCPMDPICSPTPNWSGTRTCYH